MKKIANNNCNVQHKHQQDYVQILTVSSRRINTEEKAKVVAAGWGAEFIQFLAALAILPRTILKNSVARNLIKQKRRPLHFLLSLSFFYDFSPIWTILSHILYRN